MSIVFNCSKHDIIELSLWYLDLSFVKFVDVGGYADSLIITFYISEYGAQGNSPFLI